MNILAPMKNYPGGGGVQGNLTLMPGYNGKPLVFYRFYCMALFHSQAQSHMINSLKFIFHSLRLAIFKLYVFKEICIASTVFNK